MIYPEQKFAMTSVAFHVAHLLSSGCRSLVSMIRSLPNTSSNGKETILKLGHRLLVILDTRDSWHQRFGSYLLSSIFTCNEGNIRKQGNAHTGGTVFVWSTWTLLCIVLDFRIFHLAMIYLQRHMKINYGKYCHVVT